MIAIDLYYFENVIIRLNALASTINPCCFAENKTSYLQFVLRAVHGLFPYIRVVNHFLKRIYGDESEQAYYQYFFHWLGENKIFKSGLLRANKIEASRCDARAAARLRSTAVCLHGGRISLHRIIQGLSTTVQPPCAYFDGIADELAL
jgi:hypothetical protein